MKDFEAAAAEICEKIDRGVYDYGDAVGGQLEEDLAAAFRSFLARGVQEAAEIVRDLPHHRRLYADETLEARAKDIREGK